jgi:hypothetical protein
MMNIHQDIHGVYKVRAVLFNLKGSNSVTIQIDTEGGVLEQTLYFGYGQAEKGRAAELFYALRGDPADVVGSKAEDEATIAKDTQS